jgi:hypothetical protein
MMVVCTMAIVRMILMRMVMPVMMVPVSGVTQQPGAEQVHGQTEDSDDHRLLVADLDRIDRRLSDSNSIQRAPAASSSALE